MRRKLAAVVAAVVVALGGGVAIAQPAEAQILYKCQKWNWFFGWRVVYTTDFRSYTNSGWTCYCIDQYP